MESSRGALSKSQGPTRSLKLFYANKVDFAKKALRETLLDGEAWPWSQVLIELVCCTIVQHGLRTSCPYHETSTVVAVHTSVAWLVAVCSDLAGIACACAQLVHAVSRLVFVLRLIFELLVVGVIWLLSGLFAAGVQFLYGGEDDEAIRFMEPEPVEEPVQEPVATSTPDRGRELEVLQHIIGVSGASYFGVEGHSSKQFGVQLLYTCYYGKKKGRQTAELEFDPKQRWRLERDLDVDTRRVCEAT